MSDPTERERDDLVLTQLREHGDNGAIPRPMFIWIYGSQEELEVVAERLEETGWVDVAIEDDEAGGCLLRAEREQCATDEAIYAMSDEVNRALEGTDAFYDGWETSVERSH